MSDLTIEKLEALKEGATEGPWGVSEWEDPGRKDAAVFQYDGELLPRIGIVKLKDAELIAAAPELIDDLIAEKRAHQETLHLVRELWSDVHHHGNVGRASILRHLTRILEATDE